jgi:hypothetical protein
VPPSYTLGRPSTPSDAAESTIFLGPGTQLGGGRTAKNYWAWGKPIDNPIQYIVLLHFTVLNS